MRSADTFIFTCQIDRKYRHMDLEALLARIDTAAAPHPSCIEVEGLPLLICIEEFFKIPMGIEHASPQQWVCWPSCELFHPIHKILGEL